jgi:hypothetical protein
MLDHLVALANQIPRQLIVHVLEHVGGLGATLLLRVMKAVHDKLLCIGVHFSLIKRKKHAIKVLQLN